MTGDQTNVCGGVYDVWNIPCSIMVLWPDMQAVYNGKPCRQWRPEWDMSPHLAHAYKRHGECTIWLTCDAWGHDHKVTGRPHRMVAYARNKMGDGYCRMLKGCCDRYEGPYFVAGPWLNTVLIVDEKIQQEE